MAGGDEVSMVIGVLGAVAVMLMVLVLGMCFSYGWHMGEELFYGREVKK
jgi:hypothetical protein